MARPFDGRLVVLAAACCSAAGLLLLVLVASPGRYSPTDAIGFLLACGGPWALLGYFGAVDDYQPISAVSRQLPPRFFAGVVGGLLVVVALSALAGAWAAVGIVGFLAEAWAAFGASRR